MELTIKNLSKTYANGVKALNDILVNRFSGSTCIGRRLAYS